ncbi:MAG: gamma-glutamyltransferase family protein [Tildeniella nuda ZEHNDER 1965/U140]|jgi:gamma-glutamyltranspeptidase/glutathione hydrolase|nr:gamma-glutamyltransferase family protein [Tildeniella nuda ZEHNDER 1965/U140]
MGKRGAVATSQPLAALAGMEILWQGGNAVDAAVATAIALTVLEPTSNGIGSDAFALVWDGKLHGLNASGRSPTALTTDHFAGMYRVPEQDWLSVTVPGAVSAWRSLWERWGRLPFEQLFAPAIRYAEEGYPVSPETALAWRQAEKTYLPLQGAEFQAFKQVFFPGDRAPAAGEIWRSPAHAETLRAIAQSGGDSFYNGALAEKITAFAAATGGLLTQADFAAHQADWVEPIATNYRDVTVWEMPPNGQGIAALMALNLLEGFDLSRYPRESPEVYHWQIEAMKLAFADAHRHVADADSMTLKHPELLSKEYARDRRPLISDTAIPLAEPGLPKGGTVYLATSDGELMVSFIQSNYMGFGSGILVPGTGIALHNRAVGFTLEPGHPNQIAPSKRPFHTIIPGFLTRKGQPLGPFGVMGAHMQPQGHLQVVVNLVDYGMNPQTALDAPRWQFVRDNLVLLELTVSPAIATALADRGHIIQPGGFFGRGQLILSANGVLVAASEPRADGLALAW